MSAQPMQMSKVDLDKNWVSRLRKRLKKKRRKLQHNPLFSRPFTIDETMEAVSYMKSGKAAGLDYVHPEFIRNCGPKATD